MDNRTTVLQLIRAKLRKEHRRKGLTKIAALPLTALADVTAADARKLTGRFGILNIGDINFQPAISEWLLEFLRCPKYDPGPNCSYELLFRLYSPIYHYKNHPSGGFKTDFNPVYYRGRLDGSARILVIGQDPSTDETIASRAFVGTAGQRLQFFLNKIGITKSYVIINTFIFGIISRGTGINLRTLAKENQIQNFRDRLIDKILIDNNIEAIITLGGVAEEGFKNKSNYSSLSSKHVHMTHPTADDRYIINNWNSALQTLNTMITPDDSSIINLTNYASPLDDTILKDIPREDLPFGIPDWHGTQGTNSHRLSDTEINWSKP